MARWIVIATLLLAMGAASPAWAGDREDCSTATNLVKTEPARAVVACHRLADQGEAWAQSNLSVMYAYGEGVPQDSGEARKWLRKAADGGDATAQFKLGLLYARGWGVPQDFTRALAWYRKAAEQGNAAAEYEVGKTYGKGEGVQRDYAEAAKWFRKAADRGYAFSQHTLGLQYADGSLGAPRDYVQAYLWLDLAAAQQAFPAKAHAARDRDALAAQITLAQIEQAKALVAAWNPTTGH